MTFKDIVNILKIDAPIHYVPREKMNKSNYVYCKIISQKEVDDYTKRKHFEGKEYDKTELGIYLPDVDVEEYLELEQERNPAAIENHIDDISCLMFVPLEECALVLAIYTVLHEYGHWIHFNLSGQSSLAYALWETELRKPLLAQEKEIYQMPDWHPEKMTIAKKYDRKVYMTIPSERYADQYALKNFVDSYESIKRNIVE